MIDKYNKLELLKKNNYNIIELGCGQTRRVENAITIDILDFTSVDIVADLNSGLLFIPDHSIDEIYSFHFLEHVQDIEKIMSEIYRVLKPGGKKIGTVPHFSNPHFYSDYTHKSFFGLYTFYYMSKNSSLTRKVPTFYNNLNFKVLDVRFNFFSGFLIRNYIKKFYSKVFNFNNYTREYYEENLCYLFPANEIFFKLEK
jgi:SAM-dependent methyltransferase